MLAQVLYTVYMDWRTTGKSRLVFWSTWGKSISRYKIARIFSKMCSKLQLPYQAVKCTPSHESYLVLSPALVSQRSCRRRRHVFANKALWLREAFPLDDRIRVRHRPSSSAPWSSKRSNAQLGTAPPRTAASPPGNEATVATCAPAKRASRPPLNPFSWPFSCFLSWTLPIPYFSLFPIRALCCSGRASLFLLFIFFISSHLLCPSLPVSSWTNDVIFKHF